MTALQSTKAISLKYGSMDIAGAGDLSKKPVVITLDTWQLIGFTVGISADKKAVDTTLFIGTSWAHYKQDLISPALDLSTATIIRVGDTTDSFKGQVSFIRIMTPGGGYIKTCNFPSKISI